MPKKLLKINKFFYVLAVCVAIGTVANIFIFFMVALTFAGADGSIWIRWYFDNEKIFMGTTIILSLIAFPFVKKLNIASRTFDKHR